MPLKHAFLLAALAALSSACGAQSPCGAGTGVVSNVVDGDTIDLEDGRRIRYILANAPETTSGKNDCYGQQAVAKNRELVEGKTVTLTYDQRCTDQFGRTLAYVSSAGVDVNRTLVAEGFACVLHIPPAGDGRADEFEELQTVAKTNRTGLWGACQMVTCGG